MSLYNVNVYTVLACEGHYEVHKHDWWSEYRLNALIMHLVYS